MKLLNITQSSVTGHISAQIQRFAQVLEITIATQFMWECEIAYLMECDNVQDVDFVEMESLTLKINGDMQSFERLYL